MQPPPHRFPVDTQLVAPIGEEAAAARRLKEQGFAGVFTFEGPHDVFFPLVAAAGAGVDLDLMTNVAIAFPRSPIHLAHAAWDLQAMSGGRFRLGVGSQIKAQVERRYGADWERPVARMREWLLATRAILDCWETGEPLDFRGEFTTHTLMTPMFRPGPNPHGRPPILLGALGPQMTRLAAEAADGLLIMPFNSRAHLRERTIPNLQAGFAVAGQPRDFEVVAEVIVCCGRDDAELAVAAAGVRMLIAFYGSTPAYRSVLEIEGYADLQPELNTLSKQGRWAEMGGLVDEKLLTAVAVKGTPSECAEQIRHRFGALATRLAFYQPYQANNDTTGELLDRLR